MKKGLFILILIIVGLRTAYPQDTIIYDRIVLLDGSIIECTVKNIDNEKIEYTTNSPGSIEKNKVKNIVYADGKNEYFFNNISDIESIQNNIYLKNYPVFGVSLGTPSALQFILGYYDENLGIHVSGMYWSESLYGVQTTMMFKLYDTQNFLIGIGPVIGTAYVYVEEDGSYFRYKYYYGPIVHISWYNIFIEPGITFGPAEEDGKNHTNPQFICQFGYLYRFNNGY